MCEEPYRLLRKTFTTQLAIAALLVAGIVPWVSVQYDDNLLGILINIL
jgi:hypothetical protein